MKKLKWFSFAAGILLSSSVAVSNTCITCNYVTQYRWDGANYVEVAGQFGYDYLCFDEPEVCTYYKPNPVSQPNYYVPCRWGYFFPIFDGRRPGK